VFLYGLVTCICNVGKRHMWGSNPNSEWVFGEERAQGNVERIECIRTALPPTVCPTFERSPPCNMPGSVSLGNERLGLEIETHSLV